MYTVQLVYGLLRICFDILRKSNNQGWYSFKTLLYINMLNNVIWTTKVKSTYWSFQEALRCSLTSFPTNQNHSQNVKFFPCRFSYKQQMWINLSAVRNKAIHYNNIFKYKYSKNKMRPNHRFTISQVDHARLKIK